jgi:hypothetical protein
MSDIKLNESETALWNEVGSRGDLFRAAMRDRAHEQTRVSGQMTEICDPIGRMLDAVQRTDPVPEKVYDDETVREVASLPNLHKGEPPIEVSDDSVRAFVGELHSRSEDPASRGEPGAR